MISPISIVKETLSTTTTYWKVLYKKHLVRIFLILEKVQEKRPCTSIKAVLYVRHREPYKDLKWAKELDYSIVWRILW